MMTDEHLITAEPIKVPVIADDGLTYDFLVIAQAIINDYPFATSINHLCLSSYNDLVLTHDDKLEVARLYVGLRLTYPEIDVFGIYKIRGIHTLIDLQNHAFSRRLLEDIYQKAYNSGEPPLCIAALRGTDPEVMSMILDDPWILPNEPNSEGLTPLCIAAAKGNFNLVCLLLDDDRILLDQEITPLCYAVMGGNIEVVRILLEDSRVQPNQGSSNPLLLAAHTDNIKIFHILLDYYLTKIINEPEAMRQQFKANPLLIHQLATYRHALWNRLKNPVNVNLQPNAHIKLLQSIIHSKKEPNHNLRHPLFTILSTHCLLSFFNIDPIMLEINAMVEHSLPDTQVLLKGRIKPTHTWKY